MSTAAEIMASSRNANDASARAEELTNDIDQYWDSREATAYTFADGSCLWVSGPGVNTYASKAAAEAANPPA